MTAEQGIEIVNTVKLQMNSAEQEKFKQLILNQVEEFEQKVYQCRASFRAKYGKNQRLKPL